MGGDFHTKYSNISTILTDTHCKTFTIYLFHASPELNDSGK